MALEVRNLTSGYRNKIVIRDVSFALEPGQVMAFFGHNGAGKSTTLKTILGVLRPVGGEVWLDGERLDALPVAARIARGLRMLPDRRGVFPDLTVRQNLEVVARANCIGADVKFGIADVLELVPVLRDRTAAIA